MKKWVLAAMFLASVLVWPVPTMAAVDVHVSIPLPPLLVFPAPPAVVVIPETNVYVVPDLDADVYFYGGWWWRPWEGRWYRSHSYDSGWVYYRSVPAFYGRVPSGWRNDYREHRWKGHRWDYRPIPHEQVQRNWRSWEKDRHWERQNTWGVQGLKPQTRAPRPASADRPQSQEKRQSPAVRPQQPRPQSQMDQPRQSGPQSREVRPQSSQPQQREAKEPSKPRQGKPERGKEEKQDRR
jgi:hypothetical protein